MREYIFPKYYEGKWFWHDTRHMWAKPEELFFDNGDPILRCRVYADPGRKLKDRRYHFYPRFLMNSVLYIERGIDIY